MDPRHSTWASSDRFVPKTFVRPFVRFSRIEAASGIVLLLASVAAVVWANSSFSDVYFSILEERLTIEVFGFDRTLMENTAARIGPDPIAKNLPTLICHPAYCEAMQATTG